MGLNFLTVPLPPLLYIIFTSALTLPPLTPNPPVGGVSTGGWGGEVV